MILITRPLDESLKMAALLEPKGYKFIIEPMLEIKKHEIKIEDDSAHYVITSKNARSFAPDKNKLISIPEHGKNAAELLGYIKANIPTNYGRITYLRANNITTDIAKELRNSGYDAHDTIVYSSIAPEKISKNLSENFDKITIACFFSKQTLANFLNASKHLDKSHITAILISNKLLPYSDGVFAKSVIAEHPNLDAMVKSVEKEYR